MTAGVAMEGVGEIPAEHRPHPPVHELPDPVRRLSTQTFACTPITSTSEMPRCASTLQSSWPSSVTTSRAATSISGVCRRQGAEASPHGSGVSHEHDPGSVRLVGSAARSSGSHTFQALGIGGSLPGARTARSRAGVPA